MTTDFDLTIRNGRIVNAADDFDGCIGIRDGKIVAVAPSLPAGRRDIDATGQIVVPGGIDSHCHVEQKSSMDATYADDWYSASVSAAFGGTTMIVPFAVQFKGDSLTTVADQYEELARRKAVIDYSYHAIISDPTERVLGEELPALIRRGIRSFKVFMTYDKLKLNDSELLDILAVSMQEGALPMIHAENHDVIAWVARKLLSRGHVAPKSHALSHSPIAEDEATFRAIKLASLLDVPVFIVHVSSQGAVSAIRSSQLLGAAVHGETCPQYLFLTADNLDLPGVEGAKYCCSPPPRDKATQEVLWQALRSGTLGLFSSDHAPFRFDATGKIPHGDQTTFKQMANGVPGLELRLPLLFSEGVGKGRLTLNQFVALGSANHARMYGMYPRKGTLSPGADADIAIWNPDRRVTVTADMLHDRVGYTPYEGMEIKGWPDTVISRGRVVVADNALHVEAGSGEFIARDVPQPVRAPRQLNSSAQLLRPLLFPNGAPK